MTSVHKRGGMVHRRTPESSLALQVSLHQAIEQAGACTHKIQTVMTGLQRQLQQRSRELEKWRGSCFEMEEEVERWKAQCRTLEEEARTSKQLFKAAKAKLEKTSIEHDAEILNLKEERTDLRKKLEQRERELTSWKEDCVFFAMKFMNWGPSLLKWAPALHHELKHELQTRKHKALMQERKMIRRANNVSRLSLSS